MVGLGGRSYALEMNTHWRSRDAFKASFMNIFALTDLQKVIAEKISKRSGLDVKAGRYVDISDSFHIYGSYAAEFEKFAKVVSERSFDERTWSSEFAESFFVDAREKLKNENL